MSYINNLYSVRKFWEIKTNSRKIIWRHYDISVRSFYGKSFNGIQKRFRTWPSARGAIILENHKVYSLECTFLFFLKKKKVSGEFCFCWVIYPIKVQCGTLNITNFLSLASYHLFFLLEKCNFLLWVLCGRQRCDVDSNNIFFFFGGKDSNNILSWCGSFRIISFCLWIIY